MDELAKIQERINRLERSEDQLIGERDEAQEAISQAYFLITGRSPEWSNLFGYQEALEEIDDAQHMLRAAAAPQPPASRQEGGMREALEPFAKAGRRVPKQRDGSDAILSYYGVELTENDLRRAALAHDGGKGDG